MKKSDIVKEIIADIMAAATDSKIEKCRYLYDRLDKEELAEEYAAEKKAKAEQETV